MPDATGPALDRLRGVLSGHGGCRLLSLGAGCTCPLCDLDRLAAALAGPAAPPSHSCGSPGATAPCPACDALRAQREAWGHAGRSALP